MKRHLNMAAKVALITGATSGIGYAAALGFSRQGFALSLSGRNCEKLKEISEKCREINAGKKVLTTSADLNQEEDVVRLFTATKNEFGRLDTLVNNAGIMELGTIENSSLDQFDRLMTTNVRSVFHLTQLCVPLLKESKGNIVNISSVNGLRSFPGVLTYCMSKAAVDQFTKCVALELASAQVRCNAVNPGVVVTDLQRRGGLDEEAYAKFLERSKQTHALGRPGDVDEVVEAILFLADNSKSSFITGASLPVDGGRHAMCPR